MNLSQSIANSLSDTISAVEACTDSSPRAARAGILNDVGRNGKGHGIDDIDYHSPVTSRHLRLRVDEYDMYRMEEVLKQEIG